MIAHRGASAYQPEHTFAAYDLALAQGAHALELDVRAASDGRIVVVHDPLEEGDRALWALTLDQVFDRYGTATRYLVELKDPKPQWEGAVADAIERHGLHRRADVMAFDGNSLRRLRRRAPWIALTQLCQTVPSFEEIRTYASAVGPWHPIVDVAFADAAHANGLTLRTWTVNTPAEMDRLIACGVDGLITDMPDVAAARMPHTRRGTKISAT